MTATVPDRGLRGNRDFLLLWSGAGLSFLGSRLSAFAYPLIVLWATGSAAAAGLVAFAAQLPYLLVQLPAGVAVDRFDRRKLMIICDLARLVAVGSIPVGMIFAGLNLWHLAVVAFVEGAFTVVYRIAERAALPSVVPEQHLTTAMSRNEAREQAAGLLGQPGAGVLTAVTQWFPFLATAVLHAFSLGTVLMIKKPLQADAGPAEPQKPLAALMEGLRWMAGHRFARAAAGLIAVSNLLFQVLMLSVLVIVREDGGSQTVAAVVSAVSGIGGVLGALGATFWIRRISLPALVIGANALWALLVPTTLLAASNPVALGAVYGLMSYIGAVWTVAVSAYLVRIVPDHLRGRVTSVATLLAYGPLAFGSLLGGFALATLGVTGSVLTVAGVMAALTVLAAASPGVRSLSR
ncbi:MFS transporter [Amycolatopsis magusensis]|uniref:MFS family arabinose efflux permease n=1 Tax=Amycolatopsis magusensis TaxID=882444 RepID=A0ABS4PZ62_9PSEU|nr:MFS transporter [Amycolatopsis magusensis]MBP2184190.1 putative MFS family arabinose efflux permease [Amycolatopsis magusensis]